MLTTQLIIDSIVKHVQDHEDGEIHLEDGYLIHKVTVDTDEDGDDIFVHTFIVPGKNTPNIVTDSGEHVTQSEATDIALFVLRSLGTNACATILERTDFCSFEEISEAIRTMKLKMTTIELDDCPIKMIVTLMHNGLYVIELEGESEFFTECFTVATLATEMTIHHIKSFMENYQEYVQKVAS